MNWDGINLLVFVIAFAAGSMNICLSIIFHIRKNYPWTKYYLIFQISITFILVVYALQIYANLFLADSSAVLNLVYTALLFSGTAFLIYFIPYFTSWVIASPWSGLQRALFIFLSAAFVAIAVLELVLGPFGGFRISLTAIFFGVFFFSLFVLIRNLKSIQDKDARFVSTAFIILSALMVPFVLIDIFFTIEGLSTLPIYYFWVSLIILIYLVQYFVRIPESPLDVQDSSLLDSYRITDREREIIEQIRLGMTSKEIASYLDISVNTVNNHIANIYAKTEVNSRIDLLNLLKKRI
jgi:DNA-binding CsgD family transcriptional regulator